MRNTFCTLLMATLVVACSPENKEEAPIEVVPSAPTTLTAIQTGQTEVSLSWKDNSDNESGFMIERKSGSGAFTQVGATGSNTTRFKEANLDVNATYTYRVLAHNAMGASVVYSNEVTLKMYSYVTIGTTNWMQQNLDVERYRNGDIIPQVTNAIEWANLTTGAWCYYANNTANGIVYGKLYNWYAVNDSRGLAPLGWHVATNTEWTDLTTELGGTALAGGPMKSLEHWTSPNTGATNTSGFSALGGGARVVQQNGSAPFMNLGAWGSWWTATNDYEGVSFYRILYNNNTNSEVYHNVNTLGLSVRCVKD